MARERSRTSGQSPGRHWPWQETAAELSVPLNGRRTGQMICFAGRVAEKQSVSAWLEVQC